MRRDPRDPRAPPVDLRLAPRRPVSQTARGTRLPVDGYWPDLGLVVEFQEEQHSQPSSLFDRRQTISGVGRREQRRLYDARKRALILQHGLRLVVIEKCAFAVKSRRIARLYVQDIAIVRQHLELG